MFKTFNRNSHTGRKKELKIVSRKKSERDKLEEESKNTCITESLRQREGM